MFYILAPSDYSAVSNFQITFQPDETMQCFEMNIVNDNVREGTENFTVTVSPVAGNVTTIEPATTCIMITDDDGMPYTIIWANSMLEILIHSKIFSSAWLADKKFQQRLMF